MTPDRENNFDLSGREYARVSDTKAGDTLEMDGGFTCMTEGAKRLVYSEGERIHVHCRAGEHCLDGQLSDDGTHYVGMYKVEPQS